ncbi:hypothetical protein BDK92_7649 [Micromonospora pisi]|uniref:Uncharacterized protein n=1 Tax=Micromonospora pisi TaxID=589240 RepID=A0A495JXR9_9ACTN|nr:hypothetical protein [Micromonospora pisi]RKR93132.1 hypothetical protein BDK92_7649 [Micromonospora pisi]
MRVGQAGAVAAEWVARYARDEAGYAGAYLAGSTTWLPEDAELAPTSDVDVVVLTAGDPPGVKLGKFRYHGVLLEVTHLARAEFTSADRVLGSFRLASSFRTDTVIDDPGGHLRLLQSRVAAGFAESAWVRRRCEDARCAIAGGLRALDASAALQDRVLAWVFPTSVTTQVPLVAALRNPTVRLRYPAVREVLAGYGHSAIYPYLLELLGCAGMTRRRVGYHLRQLSRTFDATVPVARTPLFFSSDITTGARTVAIDGSQALVDRGDHREAVFWIVVTFARCHQILSVDAPALGDALAPAFEELVADLGVTGTEDLRRRSDQVLRFLPELWAAAEAIIAVNPGVRHR